MLNKLKTLFGSTQSNLAQAYLEQHQIQFDSQRGYIVAGVVLNETLGERLEYLSNRRMTHFDDLKELYFTAIIINEKIDLEIANQNFLLRLGNTEENLLEFKQIVKILNDYYRQFLREKR